MDGPVPGSSSPLGRVLRRHHPSHWPHEGEVTTVDLDLDVCRRRQDGSVFMDDEDEFASNQRRYDYPRDAHHARGGDRRVAVDCAVRRWTPSEAASAHDWTRWWLRYWTCCRGQRAHASPVPHLAGRLTFCKAGSPACLSEGMMWRWFRSRRREAPRRRCCRRCPRFRTCRRLPSLTWRSARPSGCSTTSRCGTSRLDPSSTPSWVTRRPLWTEKRGRPTTRVRLDRSTTTSLSTPTADTPAHSAPPRSRKPEPSLGATRRSGGCAMSRRRVDGVLACPRRRPVGVRGRYRWGARSLPKHRACRCLLPLPAQASSSRSV